MSHSKGSQQQDLHNHIQVCILSNTQYHSFCIWFSFYIEWTGICIEWTGTGIGIDSPDDKVTTLKDMLIMLWDQSSATAKFLRGILELISEDSNPFVVAPVSSETVIHTSWFCGNCSVGKKQCKCVVTELLSTEGQSVSQTPVSLANFFFFMLLLICPYNELFTSLLSFNRVQQRRKTSCWGCRY